MKISKGVKIALSILVIGMTATAVVMILKRRKKYGCKNSFLFLGNSQTANSNGYVEKMKAKCPNAHIKKISKVGAKSDWILNEYKKELSSGGKYDVVNILIGVNDIFARNSIEKAKANIQEILDLAKANGSKVVFIGSPTSMFYSKTNPTHLRLAEDLEEWARKNKGVQHFVDIKPSTERQDVFAPDLLHLNNKGHEIIFNLYDKKVLK